MNYRGRIWLSSDFHLNHNKTFIWEERGFNSVEEMNETIVRNCNDVIDEEDTFYLLGDVFMGADYLQAREYLRSIKCKHKRLILGNHDTPRRIELFQNDGIFEDYKVAEFFGYKKWCVYLSHFPTLVGNYDKQRFAGLYGHTHQASQWDNDWQLPTMYNVGVDAHNCHPILIDDALATIKNKIKEGKGGYLV